MNNLQVSSQPLIATQVIRTLGPEGSNLELAAYEWFRLNGVANGEVILHPTVEDAVSAISADNEGVMACAAYPHLHTLIFENLKSLTIIDTFLFPTMEMVLASRRLSSYKAGETCASHRAPQALIPDRFRWIESSSNSQAARDCADNLSDACITTKTAAESNDLLIVENFGTVDMAFTLHAQSVTA